MSHFRLHKQLVHITTVAPELRDAIQLHALKFSTCSCFRRDISGRLMTVPVKL